MKGDTAFAFCEVKKVQNEVLPQILLPFENCTNRFISERLFRQNVATDSGWKIWITDIRISESFFAIRNPSTFSTDNRVLNLYERQ